MNPHLRRALLVLLLLAGAAIRLYRLTDPPLDFHPTRQMHSALIARQMYLKWRPGKITPAEVQARYLGYRMARYEPPIFEALVAKTCLWAGRRFGFHLWVARLYDLLFWLLGAWGLYLLARRLTDADAALAAVAYWMLLPFAIQASRSFQPDPLMTVLLVWAAWAALTWAESPPRSRKRPLLLGLTVALGAAAGIVKAYGLVFAGGIFVAAAWMRYRGGFWRKPAFWGGLAGLAAPVVWVYFLMPRGAVGGGFLQTWTLRMLPLWLSPKLYGGWLQQMTATMGGGFLLLALFGLVLASPAGKALAAGWGAAYAAYGFLVPFHIATHSYYHLPLLPLVALGLAAAVKTLAPFVRTQPRMAQGVLALGLLAAAVYPLGISYWQMKQCPCRQEAQTFTELGQVLPDDGAMIALTQAYGYPLMYYSNRAVDFWPTSRFQQVFNLSAEAFARLFAERTRGHAYFLVTDFTEFARQKALRHYLSTHYPVVREGQGFVLYDLRRPRKDAP